MKRLFIALLFSAPAFGAMTLQQGKQMLEAANKDIAEAERAIATKRTAAEQADVQATRANGEEFAEAREQATQQARTHTNDLNDTHPKLQVAHQRRQEAIKRVVSEGQGELRVTSNGKDFICVAVEKQILEPIVTRQPEVTPRPRPRVVGHARS